MKAVKNAQLALAVALLGTLGFVGCSGSNQNPPDQNFAQGSSASSASSSSPRKDFSSRRARSPEGSSDESSSRYSRRAPAPQPPPQPAAIVIPSGTDLRISVDQSISSATAQAGDAFDATLLNSVRVNGQTVIPSNARVKGRVVDAEASGRLSHTARLVLTLDSVEINHQRYRIHTDSLERLGAKHKKRDIIAIGGGSAVGAIIGGVVGGGKGAAIGAAAGAGAGTAGAAMTGKKNVVLPAEATLIFRLTSPVRVTQ